MPAIRWEYKIVDLAAAPLKADGDIALLNERGRQGWELVGITANAQAYLKKAVESAPKPTSRRRSKQGAEP